MVIILENQRGWQRGNQRRNQKGDQRGDQREWQRGDQRGDQRGWQRGDQRGNQRGDQRGNQKNLICASASIETPAPQPAWRVGNNVYGMMVRKYGSWWE